MYSVPIIPPDLRHEETIIQATNALDYLQKTIADVFARIDERIERDHVKIHELQNRIDSAAKTINNLIGINKAIKIFSPAKFPATNLFHDIPKTFDELNRRPEFRLDRDYRVSSHQEPISHRQIQEKLIFYHVRSNSMQTEKTKCGRIIDPKPGLGGIPSSIRSVNSLVRFNTDENVYNKITDVSSTYKQSTAQKRKEKVSSKHGQKIEAPPMSMTDRKNDRKSISNLFYTPKLNEAPQLDDVPMDLPDLPGIADDITFNLLENERIAPSLHVDNLPDLPEPESILPSSNESIAAEHSKSPDTSVAVAAKEAPKAVAPLPPPPPPLPPVDVVQQQNTSPPVATQPPPPPPPPIPLPSTSNRSAAAVGMSDARMNLMEAIRKAGGARGAQLRTGAAAEIAKTGEADAKRGEAKPPSGDLMADLHNKLLMRRKGISGAKEQDTGTGPSDSGSVLNRLSALIPPPPPKLQSAATNNSATDASDENDEWTD